MEERKTESLDEAIDELLSLGYLRYAEPDKLLEVTEDEAPNKTPSPHGTGGLRNE